MLDPETKGERAAQILDNEVYSEAVKSARHRIQDDWAGQTNAESRERLWHTLQAIEAVTRELAILRDNGIVARKKREKEGTT